MKERPILFNTEMVQAIMAGRKTQTRRIVKPQPHDRIEDVGGFYPVDENGDYSDKSKHYANGNHFLRGFVKDFSPFGQPGDHLWVRETFYIDECDCQPFYKVSEEHPEIFKWTPSIHMPRWASRITLEITNVRVERLQDIKRDDAIKEGLIHVAGQIEAHWWNNGISDVAYLSPVICFAEIWDSINKKRCFSWESNPWVWVIEFKILERI